MTKLGLMCSIAALLFPIGALSEVGRTPASEWVAFRYDSSHILFYVCKNELLKQQQPPQNRYPDPVARWGQGGYLTAVAASLLNSGICKGCTQELPVGRRLSVRIDSSQSILASVEGYVAQWGASSPSTQIGVLARVVSSDLALFQSLDAAYYIAYQSRLRLQNELPAMEVFSNREPRKLADLGNSGTILLYEGDAGWLVAVGKKTATAPLPTVIRYAYGE